MKKESINRFQLWLLFVNFQIGSALVFTPSMAVEKAKQDGWLSLIVVFIVGIFFMWLTLTLSKNQTIVELGRDLFGKVGFIIGIGYAWFYIHLAALLLREIGDVFKSTTLVETPLMAINILVALLVAYMTYSGLEVMARTNEVFTPYAFIFFWLTIFFLIPQMQIESIEPILENGIEPIISGAFPILGFTFAEVVVFSMLIPSASEKRNLKKIIISGGAVSSFSLLIVTLSTLLVLKVRPTEMSIFAPLNSARLIDIGQFLTRVEILILLAYIFTIFIKLTISFYAGVLAIAQTFQTENYRPFIIPSIIIVLALSIILSENIVEFIAFTSTIWAPYALFFSLVIPLIMLAISSWKKRKKPNA